jgi:succinate-semialdehyde dehydrogenase/glutarate-semialdehyde dehydrogenase
MRSNTMKTDLLIGGEWRTSTTRFDVHNPATGEVIARVANATAIDVDAAIDAAAAAFESWSSLPAVTRGGLLRRWFELVMEHQESLAKLMTQEQGKPLTEARAEIAYGASYIEWFAEEAKRNYGETIPGPTSTTRIVVDKQPVGVVGVITPWNFPNAMIARKLAPALAAGCTVVAKPAAETPLSALMLGHLALDAGIPAGVVNIVPSTDARMVGARFCADARVKKLSFTGSTAVGRQLIEQAAHHIKRLSLELGGNAPFIVFDDADIDAAVKGAVASKFRNAGQTCVCANRFYVADAIYDQFATRLADAMQALVVGHGMEKTTLIGPLISSRAVEKVKALVEDALAYGAVLAFQGDVDAKSTDAFYPPQLLINVSQQARLAKEEIFGPVAALIRFHTEDEAINWANDSEFGLAAYVFTESKRRIELVRRKLEVGMIGINTGSLSNAAAPFGGIKQSGWGREGGHQGLADYVNLVYICEDTQ